MYVVLVSCLVLLPVSVFSRLFNCLTVFPLCFGMPSPAVSLWSVSSLLVFPRQFVIYYIFCFWIQHAPLRTVTCSVFGCTPTSCITFGYKRNMTDKMLSIKTVVHKPIRDVHSEIQSMVWLLLGKSKLVNYVVKKLDVVPVAESIKPFKCIYLVKMTQRLRYRKMLRFVI